MKKRRDAEMKNAPGEEGAKTMRARHMCSLGARLEIAARWVKKNVALKCPAPGRRPADSATLRHWVSVGRSMEHMSRPVSDHNAAHTHNG